MDVLDECTPPRTDETGEERCAGGAMEGLETKGFESTLND